MNNHFEKFLFLGVIIAVIFFSRFAYPIGPSLPSLSLADQVQTSIANHNAPILILPTPGTAAAVVANANASSGTVPPQSQGTVVTEPISGTTTASSFIRLGNAAPVAPAVHAAIVADLTTGAIFYSMNADKRWPTASITKLMTATVALDHFDLSAKITVTPTMFAADPQEFTLVTGGTYTAADLFHVMLMPSSNVAAEAFADSYGRADFMAAMNARAEQWGMADTYFDDPSGISAANQSTAHDMLILAQKVYADYSQILSYTRTAQTTITELNSGKQVPVTSINNFAGQPDFIGGKTGHTDQADGNLLSIFDYHNHPVIIIVLGTNSRFSDTQRLYSWFKSNFN